MKAEKPNLITETYLLEVRNSKLVTRNIESWHNEKIQINFILIGIIGNIEIGNGHAWPLSFWATVPVHIPLHNMHSARIWNNIIFPLIIN